MTSTTNKNYSLFSESSSISIKSFVSNITSLLSVKLNHENYLIWRAQILTTIRAYQLEFLIDSTHDIPSEFTLTMMENRYPILFIPISVFLTNSYCATYFPLFQKMYCRMFYSFKVPKRHDKHWSENSPPCLDLISCN